MRLVLILLVAVAMFGAALAREDWVSLATSSVTSPTPPPQAQWRPNATRQWKCIVIHHSATQIGGAKRFDEAHRVRGWENGLGYHFVIGNGSDTNDGHIEVGPRWQRQIAGAHCKTPDDFYNEHGIGICLVGNFDKTHPTPRQLQALTRLVRFLCQEYDIPPSRIYTHGQVTGQTACPGKHFDLQQLREAIRRPG